MKRIIFRLLLIATIIECCALGSIAVAKRENKVQDAYIYGQSVAGAIRLTLDNTLEATEALKYFYIEYGEECFDRFDEIAAQIMADHPAIASMYIAPDAVIAAAYPEEVAASTIGFEMLKDPEQGPRAQLAIDTKEITVAGPHELVEGGIGFIIRNPVFDKDRFIGFTIIVLDWDIFVEKVLENVSDPAGQYNYAVWKENRDETAVTDEDGFILRNSDEPISQKVDIEFEVPNDIWHLIVEPKDGWAVVGDMTGYIAISLFIIAMLIMLFVFSYTSNERKQLLDKEKYESESKSRYMTQLAEALERAQKADAAKSRFLSRMSHDIRTPLNGIMGLIEIDDLHPDDVKLLAENRRKQKVAAGHLMALLNDILDMSKLEDGKVELAHEPINLKETGRDIETIIEQRAAEAGIRLELVEGDVENAVEWVYGSPLHIRQIFLNIYSNCIKYNRTGGKLSVQFKVMSLDEEKAVYRWIISDTGIGMSEDFLKRLFEPFSQEHVDARSVYRGTGLGMSIVKSLIDLMQGDIEVQSREGEGTVFTVTLPFELVKPEDIPGQPEAPEGKGDRAHAPDGEPLSGTRILLVEDNMLNAEIAAALLMDLGAEVMTAGNGQEACDRFRESEAGSIDVILMDIMMPVMDGLTAAKKIREMPRQDAKTVTIIAVTANAFVDDIRECMEAGMNDHLSKPIEVDKMKETLMRYRRKSALIG